MSASERSSRKRALPGGRVTSRNAQRLPSIRSLGTRPSVPDDSSEPGASMRSTSAPQAARKRVAVGPATTRVQSRTLTPARGRPGAGSHELPSAAEACTCTIGSACVALPAGWVNHSSIVRLSATVTRASTSCCSISSPGCFRMAAATSGTSSRVPRVLVSCFVMLGNVAWMRSHRPSAVSNSVSHGDSLPDIHGDVLLTGSRCWYPGSVREGGMGKMWNHPLDSTRSTSITEGSAPLASRSSATAAPAAATVAAAKSVTANGEGSAPWP
jgi:hypothetical protein